jgi:hypothetical protein
MQKTFVTFLFLITARLAFADGGTIQSQGDSGPFHITVFTAPAILNAGPVDITVLVQDRSSLKPLLDADVHFDFLAHSGGGPQQNAWSPPACVGAPTPKLIAIPARLNHGENKLLHGAVVQIPHSGAWDLQVNVQKGTEHATISTSFNVNPPASPPLAYWHLFIIPPVGIAGFILHQTARRWKRGNKRH